MKNTDITFKTTIMKKILSLLLLALPLTFALSSCSDEDDMPNVDMSLNISGGTMVDNTIYLVQGDTLVINGINVTNNEAGKAAAVTAATYFWDYTRLGTAMLPPYGFKIITTKAVDNLPGTPLGRHLLEIECPLIAVDKEVATAIMAYTVQVVENADDIPAGGQTTINTTPALNK